MLQSGIVKRIITRPWGNKTFYSVALTNSENLFGFGPHNPKVNEGDDIEFEANTNAKGYWEAKSGSLVVRARGSEQTAQGASAAVVAKGVMTKDDYWGRKEARDVKQDELREIGATRNTAIEWIKFLFEKEALKMPAKPAERESFLNDVLADYINKFRGKETASAPAPVKGESANGEEADDPEWK